MNCTCQFLRLAGPGGLAPVLPAPGPAGAPCAHAAPSLGPGKRPSQPPPRASRWDSGRGYPGWGLRGSSTRLERSEKPPLKLRRGTASSPAGPGREHGHRSTSVAIRGLENSLWGKAGELGLLSLEEKAGSRAGHNNAVAVHERLLLREAVITLLEGQR